MLPSLWLNALTWNFLYSAILASASGRSGYNNGAQAEDAADGLSGYNKVKRSTWTGNWTTAHCTHIAVRHTLDYTADERWSMLDCDHAWSDALNIWRTQDRGKKTFSKSIWDTFQAPRPAICQTVIAKTDCDKYSECLDDPGAAGYEVINSLVRVHGLQKSFYSQVYYEGMPAANSKLDNQLTFLDRAEDPVTVQSLLDFIKLGLVTLSSFHITEHLKQQDFFFAHPDAAPQDVTRDVMSPFVAALKDISTHKPSIQDWKPEGKDNFMEYLRQALWAWGNATEAAVFKLFDGSEDSIQLLTKLISNGKMIIGGAGDASGTLPEPFSERRTRFASLRAFYSYAIPAEWSATSAGVFVMDTGYSCSQTDVTPKRLDARTAEATRACYDGKLYHVVHAESTGDAVQCQQVCSDKTFSTPPGWERVGPATHGNVTVQDLVAGSLRTYKNNGNKNGAAAAKITDSATLTDLINQDITTPGFIRIPVCSADEAFRNWANMKYNRARYSTFPCNKVE